MTNPMMDENQAVHISLTPAEAVVLADYLMVFTKRKSFQALHRAERHVLHKLYALVEQAERNYQSSLSREELMQRVFDEVLKDEWSLEERLYSVAADLLTDKPHELFVRRLAQSKVAEWQSVAALCEGMEELPRYAVEVFGEVGDEFVVMRLPWPWLAQNDAEFMVLFYCEREFWNTTAYYNGGVLK
jgi:hypothetical protein